MVLTEAGGGTRISSTRSFLYGDISAAIKTVGAVGVVTAFITMSGVKDEIDWEFTSSNMSQGQVRCRAPSPRLARYSPLFRCKTNYYWEGDTANCTYSLLVLGLLDSLASHSCLFAVSQFLMVATQRPPNVTLIIMYSTSRILGF